MKHPIGYFEVTSSGKAPQLVIVSQEMSVTDQNVIVASRKIFTLNTENGEEIFPTKDSQTFSKKDGTLFRKLGLCRVSGGSRNRIEY
ncbi:hypothetical protein [Desulfopila aestuarii]|uniref:Uncharacterized protein n=1 Tax=Desulfopila aestuarii DSM 18488 TaxID=1121416 RepID=A0A1M7YBC4_9BACT|nr:hypothetical protein [Desulfopila aestuarii]SHO49935.1 hypothetical protein SAMN02745220_03171 [Desulfopila aestuarii DSM 18488]